MIKWHYPSWQFQFSFYENSPIHFKFPWITSFIVELYTSCLVTYVMSIGPNNNLRHLNFLFGFFKFKLETGMKKKSY